VETQVLDGRHKKFGIVHELAQSNVAVGAKQTSDGVGCVVVVDRERFDLSINNGRFWLLADCA
jgi:hypothetical protein